MSGEPARLHPDDIRAIAAEVARELGHRDAKPANEAPAAERKRQFAALATYREPASPLPASCGECSFRRGGRPHDWEWCGHPDGATVEVDFAAPPVDTCPLRRSA